MAVVGEAHVIVRAITTSVRDDIKKGFSGVEDEVSKAGRKMARTFQNDFSREAEGARQAFAKLQKTGFVLQTALGGIVGAIGSVIGALGALIGAAGGAAASVVALGNVIVAMPAIMGVFKFALGGVGAAVSAYGKASGGARKSTQELREEMQQLRFEAEEAALAEEDAAIRLEQARENLARTADLPINSMARREAELQFKQAELAYRRAKDRTRDLNEELKKGPKDDASGGGGSDPFAGLTEAQKRFAKFLISIKPLMNELRRAAGDSFLPVLEAQMRRLINQSGPTRSFFEVLRDGLRTVSLGLGDALTKITDSLVELSATGELDELFKNMRPTIEALGGILASGLESFVKLLNAAYPVTERFLNFISNNMDKFSDFLSVKGKTGELQAFFERAGELASDFGEIFGNVFNFLGDIIEANFGPLSGGQYMLNWLKNATSGWADMSENIGKSNFANFFREASINARTILRTIGLMFSGLGKLAIDPNIKLTFDTLAKGAPYFGRIVEEGLKAAPLMADLLFQLTRITAILGDSGAIKMFFGTLKNVAQAVANILENEFVKKLVDIGGMIVAVALAFGTLKKVFSFVALAAGGSIMSLVGAMMGLTAAEAAAELGATRLGKALGLASKAGGWITAIMTVVAGMVALDGVIRDARQSSLATGQDLRNSLQRGVPPIGLLRKAFEGLDGDLLVTKKRVVEFGGGIEAVKFDTIRVGLKDIVDTGDGVATILKAMSTEVNGFGKQLNTAGYQGNFEIWDDLEKQFGELGSTLTETARSDLPAAQTAFIGFTKQLGVTGKDAEYLLEAMGPEFTQVLSDYADAAGLGTDTQSLLNIALNKGEGAADAVAASIYGVGWEAKQAEDKIKQLKDEIISFGNEQLDTNAAQREFESAIDDAATAAAEYVVANGNLKGALDLGTEAGRKNSEALDEIARSGKEYALALYEQTNSEEDLQKAMDDTRANLEATAIQLGMNEQDARDYANQLLGTPAQIETAIKLNTAAATASLYAWVNTMPKNVFLEFKGAERANGGFIGNIPKFAPGGMVRGLGGPRSDLVPAMLSNGEYVINANSTARYLPLIEAINQSGLNSLDKSPNSVGGLGGSISIVVNPAPGMDEIELAAMVSRRISHELRRGASS
jgi:hypothetical protein